MSKNITEVSGKVLEKEMNWFHTVLEARIQHYFRDAKEEPQDPLSITPPAQSKKEDNCYYAGLVNHYQLAAEERLVLMLALAPDIKPEFLDILFTRNSNFDRGFSEFGGILGKRHSGFIPTIETAYFLLCGGSIRHRLHYAHFFENTHIFQRFKILDLDYRDKSEPMSGAPLRLNQDVLDMLVLGYVRDPETGVEFPAKRLDTGLQWEDIVFSPQTYDQLEELRAWLEHEKVLLDDWRFRKYIKPGYRCLFYGPPGTGKTLTAGLLGKLSGRAVYRIDLSQLVSKYIGETEKNLEKIFTQAEMRNWILFFDEADAIFGKRTSISDAHDRYANQGTSYLLQRIEDCPNVVILASNNKANIDDAFYRRFQSTVYFPIPRKPERLKLWEQGFSPVSSLESSILLEEIAEEYEMAGGAIMNVIRFASLMAIKKKSRVIFYDDLLKGIQREFNKEGRTV
jgi:hypothetical protein